MRARSALGAGPAAPTRPGGPDVGLTRIRLGITGEFMITDRLPAKFGGRGPLWCALFMVMGSAGVWSWLTIGAPGAGLISDSLAHLVGAGAPVPASHAWTPKFRNDSRLCLESARQLMVLSWYAGAGGRVCPKEVETSGCVGERALCRPAAHLASASVRMSVTQQNELGAGVSP